MRSDRIMETLKKYRYPALILALGLLLLLLPGGTKETAETEDQTAAETDFDLEEFTKEAEELLSGIQGAGEVRLLLTLESDGRRDYQTDLTQSQGDSSSQLQRQTVLVSQDGDETPVTVTRYYPEFRGAVVLTEGADSPSLTLSIKEALSSLTGLGMDKITVLKSN